MRFDDVEQKKRDGVVYTPEALARFVARRLLACLPDDAPSRAENKRKLAIYDPAVGDGALLHALASELVATGQRAISIRGGDIDADALALAADRLSSFEDVELEERDFLAGEVEVSPDLLIANPPYVRTQILGADVVEDLRARFGLTGRIDLSHAFLLRALDALAHSMHIRGLRHLDLSRTGITSAGVARLMRSPAVSALVSLDLSETAIDDEALVAIAESNHLGRLRSLSFRHTDVSYKGWQALSSSPNAHYLEQIGVFGSSLSVPGVLELVARSEHLGPWIHRALERAMNPRPAYR